MGRLQEKPQVEVVDILDARGLVVCAGALIAPDWVLTAGACADAASEVLLWGLQRVGCMSTLRYGAVALLRLEHGVCLTSVALRMDDGSAIGHCRPSSDCQHSQLPTSVRKPVGRVRTTCTGHLRTVKPHASMFFASGFGSHTVECDPFIKSQHVTTEPL